MNFLVTKLFKSDAGNYTGCCAVHQIIIKNFFTLFHYPYKMGGKEIDFKDKKNQ